MRGHGIEVDGATHASAGEVARDPARAKALLAHGFAALTFTNNAVFHDLDDVLETIHAKLTILRPRIDEQST